MKVGGRSIDHIVYAVPDLASAVRHFHNEYGITAILGGKHHSKGTKNALVNLGNSVYLEILAIDHENQNIKAPRWMGMDLISEAKITRWSITSNQLEKDQAILQSYHPQMGIIEEGARETPDGSILKWKMILPLSKPEVEIIPFMTDWSLSSFHPTERLEQNCTLEEIILSTSADDHAAKKCISQLFNGIEIVPFNTAKINIKVDGPKGTFYL